HPHLAQGIPGRRRRGDRPVRPEGRNWTAVAPPDRRIARLGDGGAADVDHRNRAIHPGSVRVRLWPLRTDQVDAWLCADATSSNELISSPVSLAAFRMRSGGPTRIGSMSPSLLASIAPPSETSSQGSAPSSLCQLHAERHLEPRKPALFVVGQG